MSQFYQNLDLSLNKFFLRKDFSELVLDIKQLKNSQLDKNIYFRPSACPLINVNNSSDGSCFEEYRIPTASYQFEIKNNKVYPIPIEKNLNLNEYIDVLYQNIYNRIHDIYQRHSEVTLSYSGGIDSMVLLSFIQAQGLLSRTRVVCFENQTQNDPSCLHLNIEKKNQVTALLDTIKDQVLSIQWLAITQSDFISSFNNQSLEHTKCYVTNAILQNTNSTAYIFGYHGNQVLLHKNIFIDEIILTRNCAKNEMLELLLGSANFYTQSLVNYNVDSPKIGIDQRHMLQKPWSLLSSDNKVIYSPLADDFDFIQLRKLDYGKISISTIADATVAREMLDRNVGQNLNSYITTDGVKEQDNLECMVIPLDQINPKLLSVPGNLNHNTEGLDYLQYEIELTKTTNEIAINTLVSIKALSWLSQI